MYYLENESKFCVPIQNYHEHLIKTSQKVISIRKRLIRSDKSDSESLNRVAKVTIGNRTKEMTLYRHVR